ncbi:MAG: bifunctional hydroxymethylpyrimidine kinase/phosphomethylpyrimidine kinase [Verrucomicrobiota bacterium]
MKKRATMPVALTIAGSDSGGGAGIQADLKTFQALGVFGTSAITAITCQNPAGVSAVQPVKPRIVAEQISQVCTAFPVRAAKTGMLYDAKIIRAVAGSVRCRLVVDPVMVATSGVRLLKPDAIRVLQKVLFPMATVVTPNLAEAEVLLGCLIRTLPELRAAAQALADRHGVAFLVKGGHLTGDAVDVLCASNRLYEFDAPHITGVKTHGTGCVFSAALTAHLALGYGLVEAVGRAKTLVTHAIRDAVKIGRYHALKI